MGGSYMNKRSRPSWSLAVSSVGCWIWRVGKIGARMAYLG